VDLSETSDQAEFRREARAWLERNVPANPLASFDSEKGFDAHRQWEARLAADRWSAVSWPEQFGGRGVDYLKWLVFEEEYYRVDAPGRVNQNGIFLLGPTIMEVGSAAQQERFLPATASGEIVWAQAWSEPDAGSDLAAIRSTATLDDSGTTWTLSGQKTWSSRAAWADWCFGIFRSVPGSERHRGLTFVLVPLTAPGITVRPIPQLDGRPGFAEIFFDDVQVPVDCTLGPPGDGWRVAMATAGFERGMSLRSPGRFQATAQRLIRLWGERGDPADSGLRDRVVEAWMQAEAYTLHTYSVASRLLDGGSIGPEASLTKIFWSELDVRMHELALDILGSAGDADEAGPLRRWTDGYLFSLTGPIYAGTNEIQRTIIADRLLSLPRER
jgi:alkylation response protein AidB-like acyl-CoA dehydrogenase